MEFDSKAYIDEFLARARAAQAIFETLPQETVDRAAQAVGKVVYDHAEYLAEIAVEETGMGNVPDKIAKNRQKSKIIWNSLKGRPSRGILDRNPETGITRVAKPMGVVAAITPCTNPIVTPMSNIMFALKAGNAIIITPHHKAIRCSSKTVELINESLKKLGMPEGLVQILDQQSRENTRNLIASADVVVATGGMGMVHAAYSSGRPALGVGAGNVQCILDRQVDLGEAIPKVVAGRSFDNGIICSGEQSLICPEEEMPAVLEALAASAAFVVSSPEDKAALRRAVFDGEGRMNRHAVGQSAEAVGQLAGLAVPPGTKTLVVFPDGSGGADFLAKEKMCPVLSLYSYRTFEEAVSIARENLEAEGKGHSVSLHSNNVANIEYAAENLSVSRFVVNQPCASSAGGSFYNGLNPTNTLGCGSWGHNSLSENLTFTHLMNVSRIAYYMPDNPVPSDEELWGGL